MYNQDVDGTTERFFSPRKDGGNISINIENNDSPSKENSVLD